MVFQRDGSTGALLDPAPARARRPRTAQLIVLVAAVMGVSACQSTTITGLNVRAAPTTASPVLATLGDSGTAVTITCFVHGQAVHEDPIWYYITRPETGFVSNYYIRTDQDMLATSRSC